MTDNVTFQQPGPFGLPAAQSATARALGSSVELRIGVMIEGELETLTIQMTSAVATDMATALYDAASKAK